MARATRCVATPSTVYGEEVVTFEVAGDGPAGATLNAAIKDERGRTVAVGSVGAPGTLRLPGLPSGDFEMVLDSAVMVSCRVTVNRELPRASSAAR